jgi:hypothetical protein
LIEEISSDMSFSIYRYRIDGEVIWPYHHKYYH